MSEFWSVPLADALVGRRVCAICGKVNCKGDAQDPRETQPPEPINAVDEPDEEVR